MGKSEKRVKPERINALKKRYDALLEEDKKRKQRNEYIIGSLDKIRSCSSLVPIRRRHVDMASFAPLNNLKLTSEKDSSIYEVQIPRSYPSPVPISTKYTDESLLISQLSKKFILIPKLNSSITLVNNIQSINDNVFDTNDWRNKYKILEKLKQDEKEQFQSPEKQQIHNERDMILNSNQPSKMNVLQEYDLPVRENTYKANSFSQEDFKTSLEFNNDKKEKLTTTTPESFTSLNTNRLGLKGQDYIPTSPHTFEYEYKVDDDKEKSNQPEDNYRYGPHGPQTEPFTYEYPYKDHKDIKEDIIPTNETIEQIYQNPSSDVKNLSEKDLSKSFKVIENSVEGFNDISDKVKPELFPKNTDIESTFQSDNISNQSKRDVEMKKLAEVSETNPLNVHTRQFEETEINYQSVNPSVVESDIVYVNSDINSLNKPMYPESVQISPVQNKKNISQEGKIKQNNNSAINPPETTYEDEVVYNPTEPDYNFDDSNYPQDINPHPLTTQDPENDTKHYDSNEIELDYPKQQQYDENQLHGPQAEREEQYNIVQQELEQINHDDNLTNQEYELDDQTQNEYNPNQVNYDPDQQEYEATQKYDVDQVGFETEATSSVPNQKEYALADHPHDLETFNTNPLGSDNDQLQNAIDDQQKYAAGDQQQYTIGKQQQKAIGDQLQYKMADQQQYTIGDQEYVTGDHQQYAVDDHEQFTVTDQKLYVVGDEQQYVVGDHQEYAVGDQQEYAVGDQQYAVGDQQEYAVGDQQEYAVGDQQYAVGDQQEYAVGDQQEYAVGDQQEYAVGDQQYAEGDQQQYLVDDQQYAIGDQQYDESVHQDYVQQQYEYEMQQNNQDYDTNVMTQEHSTNQEYKLNDPSLPVAQKEPQIQVQHNNIKISDQKVLKADNKIVGTKKNKDKNKEQSVEQTKVARKLRA